jgi:hypothetical protein
MTEARVQEIVAEWLRREGYSVTEKQKSDAGVEVDLVARSARDAWVIEVKGDYDRNSAQYNVNFDTGMGQLLKSVSVLDGATKYAIAVPFTRTERRERLSYRRILPKYARSLAFERLNIHLLLVRDDESVEVIAPNRVGSFVVSIGSTVSG